MKYLSRFFFCPYCSSIVPFSGWIMVTIVKETFSILTNPVQSCLSNLVLSVSVHQYFPNAALGYKHHETSSFSLQSVGTQRENILTKRNQLNQGCPAPSSSCACKNLTNTGCYHVRIFTRFYWVKQSNVPTS